MASPPVGAIYQITSTATTGNTGGAGFNPTATYFNTDLAATVGTTSAPSVTSASYTFIAGDIGAWVYIKSGTNWIPGWYNITNVISGAAILNATIGAAILSIGAQGLVTYSNATGCVNGSYVSGTASGTYGVDYSQQDAIQFTSTTATSSGSGSVILFAGSSQSMLGNYVQIISGTLATPGWYEIIAESSGVSITTDRASTTGIASGITMNIGGAGRLNGNEDAFKAMIPAGSIVWVKNGSYTFSAASTTASTQSTAIAPSFFIGFNSVRGDVCNGANRPILALGANSLTWCQYQNLVNIIGTTTAAAGFTQGQGGAFFNCKITNSSSTAARVAITTGNATFANSIIGCEVVSQNGIAINITAGVSIHVLGNYIHDSATGVSATSGSSVILGNIFEANTTAAFANSSTTATNVIENNTFYGNEAKTGIGLNLSGANSPGNRVINNILYGLTTGITVGTGTTNNNISYYNDFFNNTTDVTNWLKSSTDLAVNPTFTGASQLTNIGTVSTTGSVLTDTGASFGVTDNVDYLHVTASTGGTVGCYLITSHTGTTLTVNNALGSGTAVSYFVTHGHNFQIGTNLKALGFPSLTNATGSQTTSYEDIGAAQRQEPAGGSGGSFTFIG